MVPDSAIPTIGMSSDMRGAFEGVVDVHAKRAAGLELPVAPPIPGRWLLATVASWLVLAFLLIAPPSFARPPAARTFEPPRELRIASLRFGLWLARHRVDAFTRSAGRLPSFAGEAGVDDPAIAITATGERSYRLAGRDGPDTLVLTSAMAVDSFLGESLTTLLGSRTYQQATSPGRTTAR